MPAAIPCLTVAQGRRLLLGGQALLGPLPPDGLAGLVRQLGYVQLDSINVLERAHHLILGSRSPDYAPAQLEALLEGRRLFEHWTHDAAAIPLEWYPHWQLRFPLSRARILASPWWRERVGEQAQPLLAHVLARIQAEGPLRSADFEHPRQGGEPGWWGWKPQKAALELLWHTGELAVAGRAHFHKIYDLPARVFPEAHARPAPEPQAHLDWACATALERLGLATPRELAAYWDAVQPAAAAAWCAAALAAGRIERVDLEAVDGAARTCFAVPDWRERLAALPEPERTVLLCPFDPILRDRARARALFGFDYRFEAFVPAARRQYGYYVLPILEGDALVGRLDAKLHRERAALEVKGLWWEPGVRPAKARLRRLRLALETLALRLGAGEVQYP